MEKTQNEVKGKAYCICLSYGGKNYVTLDVNKDQKPAVYTLPLYLSKSEAIKGEAQRVSDLVRSVSIKSIKMDWSMDETGELFLKMMSTYAEGTPTIVEYYLDQTTGFQHGLFSNPSKSKHIVRLSLAEGVFLYAVELTEPNICKADETCIRDIKAAWDELSASETF